MISFEWSPHKVRSEQARPKKCKQSVSLLQAVQQLEMEVQETGLRIFQEVSKVY